MLYQVLLLMVLNTGVEDGTLPKWYRTCSTIGRVARTTVLLFALRPVCALVDCTTQYTF